MNGSDSMSPIVPPISVMITSAFVSSVERSIRLRISSVTFGMTWTVPPLYPPSRSRWRTVM